MTLNQLLEDIAITGTVVSVDVEPTTTMTCIERQDCTGFLSVVAARNVTVTMKAKVTDVLVKFNLVADRLFGNVDYAEIQSVSERFKTETSQLIFSMPKEITHANSAVLIEALSEEQLNDDLLMADMIDEVSPIEDKQFIHIGNFVYELNQRANEPVAQAIIQAFAESFK